MELNLVRVDDLSIIKNKIEAIEIGLKKKQAKPQDVLLDNKEFCSLLKISTRTAQSWRDEGKITFTQIGSKILYRMSDVETFLSNHRKSAFS